MRDLTCLSDIWYIFHREMIWTLYKTLLHWCPGLKLEIKSTFLFKISGIEMRKLWTLCNKSRLPNWTRSVNFVSNVPGSAAFVSGVSVSFTSLYKTAMQSSISSSHCYSHHIDLIKTSSHFPSGSGNGTCWKCYVLAFSVNCLLLFLVFVGCQLSFFAPFVGCQ